MRAIAAILTAVFLTGPVLLPAAQIIGTAIPESGTGFELETKDIERRPGNGVPPSVLIIDSVPSGAAVYINFAYAGVTPLTVGGISPGGYRITLQKDRFKPASIFLSIDAGRSFILRSRMEESTGTLKVVTVPGDAEVFAGPYRLYSSETPLPAGLHRILVRRFGYEDFTADAVITEDRTTIVEAVLKPAIFAVDDFSASRKFLNPDNPGLLGRTDFSFRVTSPGRAGLQIFDSAGEAVRSMEFPAFSTWVQSFRWDGRTDRGTSLPDGLYTARLTAESPDGAIRQNPEAQVRIDRSVVIRYRSLWHGQTGLMYAPAATVLPPGSFQISSAILGLASVPGESRFDSLYLAQAGSAVGIAPRLELAPLLSLTITNDENPADINASLGLKYLAFHGTGRTPLSLGFSARGVLSTEPSFAGYSQFPGLALGAILESRFGPFGFVAAPEVLLSPYPLGISTDTGKDAGFHASLVSRFSLFFDTGGFLAGFSAAAANDSSPIFTGFEIHALIPNSLLYLSGFVSWEYRSRENDRILAGGGLGIIY